MSNIVEVLGEKKNAVSTNQTLNTRITLEEPSRSTYESNLFLDVSQDQQFVIEKEAGNVFRFYGKIAPIINTQAYNKSINPVKLIPAVIDKSILDFNTNNWSVVLLRTIPDNIGGKGVKQIHNIQSNVNFDFNFGLPALKTTPQLINGARKKGFLLFLGHNLALNDKIYIKNNESAPTNYIADGIYNVIGVNGNRIFIDVDDIYRLSVLSNTAYAPINNASAMVTNGEVNVVGTNTQVNNPQSVKSISSKLSLPVAKSSISAGVSAAQNSVMVRNVDLGSFTDAQLTDFNSPRPTPYLIAKPNFYIKKIVENELLEYYVKKATVIGVLDSLDDCAFSITPYGYGVKSYTFNSFIETGGLTDHLNYPITDIYLGIIKNGGNKNTNFGDVESNFSNLIEFTNNGDGIETINPKNYGSTSKRVKIGDTFLVSLCEYSTENLSETEIMKISHRLISNDVLFHYSPFQNITLRHKSIYIEDSDNNKEIPSYSIYSKTKEKYIWRDIFDIGIADENGTVVDFPFMNGMFYVFNTTNFFVNIEKNKTPKYKLDVNDITNLDALNGNGSSNLNNLLSDINSLTSTILGDPNNEDTTNPYESYKDRPC